MGEKWVPIVYFLVILKIPVAAMLWVVWWAWKAQPAPEEAPEEGGGSHRFGRFRRPPKRPRSPRRGPHAPDAIPLPACPPGGRVHVFTPPAPVRAASAHTVERGHTEPAER